MTSDIAFRKGHGTGNDFVLLPDPDDAIMLTPHLVAALCDRRRGLGADGVLRAVPHEAGHWFMDYWNADGSLAEMCGNGARVFARHLVDTGVEAAGDLKIVTRGGIRDVHVPATGDVTVDMGAVTALDAEAVVSLAGRSFPAVGALAPNPHAVVFLTGLAGLGDISGASAGPTAAFPDGANVEFVEASGPRRVDLRVWERGSGETLSCGTGACAVAWVHDRRCGGAGGPITVGVPGGELVVDVGPTVTLTGPVEWVASGHLDAAWWADRAQVGAA